MKILFLLLSLTFPILGDVQNSDAQNFFLHENGITVMCPNATVGETGEVNGVTYTKRGRNGLDELINFKGYTPLTSTCTSGVKDMSNLFKENHDFNKDISHWDVSSVTNMRSMFRDASDFNQDISSWDVSMVEDMNFMFLRAKSFNQDIGNWDVGNVTGMFAMFSGANRFNANIGDWDVSSVTDMWGMFWEARSFNQDIGGWDIGSVRTMSSMLDSSGIEPENYDNILKGWSKQDLKEGIDFGAEGLQYHNSRNARQYIIENFDWTIDDEGTAED